VLYGDCVLEAVVDCWRWKLENVLVIPLLFNYFKNYKTYREYVCIAYKTGVLFSLQGFRNFFISDKYLARYTQEEHIGLRVKSPLNMSDLNEILFGSSIICNIHQHHISWKSVPRFSSPVHECRRKEGRTDGLSELIRHSIVLRARLTIAQRQTVHSCEQV
jgi:hypothetical protein